MLRWCPRRPYEGQDELDPEIGDTADQEPGHNWREQDQQSDKGKSDNAEPEEKEEHQIRVHCSPRDLKEISRFVLVTRLTGNAGGYRPRQQAVLFKFQKNVFG